MESDQRRLWRITVVDGTLRTFTGGPALEPLGGGRFRVGPRGAELLFPAASSANAQELHVLAPPLAPAVFKRLPPLNAAGDLTPFAGRYHSPELGATYEVTIAGPALWIVRPRTSALTVEPIGPNLFAAPANSPTVTFQRAAGGAVTGMAISMGRVRRLPFTRVGGSGPGTAGR